MAGPEKKGPRSKTKSKNRSKDDIDDTPRRFKRLMELQQRMSQPKPAAGRQVQPKAKPAAKGPSEPTESAKIERKRGESMSEFSRRVDQAIPVPKAKGVESRKTIRNSKKHKTKAENLRSEYRQRWEAKKRRMEEQELDEDDLNVSDDDEDIWARVNAKKNQPKFGEVADRPPELPKPKSKGSIPKNVGSLARRQMLEEERERFIEQYRKLRGTDVQVPEDD